MPGPASSRETGGSGASGAAEIARPFACGLRARLNRFARARIAPEVWNAQPHARTIHDALVASIVDIPSQAMRMRRPSLSLDGTRISYSFKTGRAAAGRPALRMLVEPGGIGLDVAGQIDFSLATLGAILERLGWTHLAAPINGLVSTAFPSDPGLLNDWWGGLWLGSEIGPEGSDLRLYVNLRSGDAAERWQRVADMLGPHAGAGEEGRFLALVERVAACRGTPIGCAVVLAGGALVGFRLYAAIDCPTPVSVRASMPRGLGEDDVELEETLARLVRRFGPLAHDAATVAYDFAMSGGALSLEARRFKADIGVLDQFEMGKRAFFGFVDDDLPWAQRRELDRFLSDVEVEFDDYCINYMSFGFRQGACEERSYYVIPGNAGAVL